MPVLSGASGAGIAEKLAPILDMEHVALESRRFPDGEAYVRIPPESIESVRSESVVLVSNTFPDSGIMQTLLLLGAIRDVRKGDLSSLKGEWSGDTEDVGPGVFLAIPYYGYARQDKRFSAGESISAKMVTEVVSRYCDGIAILDLHAPEVLEGMDVPIEFVSSMPEIAERLQNGVSPDFILSPDKGAISRATEVAGLIGCDFSYLEKTRIDAHTIEHTPKNLDVSGKVVAIVDDMISTGGTICRASDALRRQGATEVHAACTHGLFTGGALSRLANHVDGVYTTDSLPNPRASVSAAPALARGLSRLMEKVTHNG
ncbi:MAG: ribose-phosphate diphosphokinase [Candidatus Thalassarchaeaceae archaeon]|nr:ribose-phosphate diphosphokinase [Candidatus Thalassarchaeaceae archaeon]